MAAGILKAIGGWAARLCRNSMTPGTTAYKFWSLKPVKAGLWGFGTLEVLKAVPHVFPDGLVPSVGYLAGDAAFGKGASQKAIDTVSDAAKDVKDAAKSLKESATNMKENVSNMMHSAGQQMQPAGGNMPGYGGGMPGGYDVRQQEAALWNTGNQLGGDDSILGGMGSMLTNFLSGNSLRLAALPIAAFMLFGRHGWLTRIAGLLLGGSMMRQLSMPAIAPSVNRAIDNMQQRHSAQPASNEPAVMRNNNNTFDDAGIRRGLQYAQSHQDDEQDSQYVVHSRRA